MLTRATVAIHGVYLYQHWDGDNLAEKVRKALLHMERWDDPHYLARIIFCEMIKDAPDPYTGFGIQSENADDREFCVFVDCDKQEINLENRKKDFMHTYTFEQFIEFPFDDNFEQVK